MILTAGARRRNSGDSTPYAMPTARPWRAPVPAITPTYDGTGSAIHPSVVDMGTPWRGFRYWMAMTPYYNSSDPLENPSVLGSSDGFTWVVPPGLTNPVYQPSGSGPNDYYADTELAYDPTTDEMVLMFKGVAPTFYPQVARSSDGVNWPASPTQFAWPNSPSEQVSPALLYVSPGLWYCWTIQNNPRTLVRWSATSPEGPWSQPAYTTGDFAGDTSIWHHDVIRDGVGIYRLLVHSGVWESDTHIWAGSSNDGLAWSRNPTPVLSDNTGGWDTDQLYRPTLTEHENGTHARVWYSARQGSSPSIWRIGYTQIPLTEWPAPPA